MNSKLNRSRSGEHDIMGMKTSFFLKRFVNILKAEMVPLEIIDTNGNRHLTFSSNPPYKLEIKDNRFFKALVSPDAYSLGHAYINGYFDVSGNLAELYDMVCKKLLNKYRQKGFASFLGRILVSGIDQQKQKEKKNIEYHYDVPSGFYRKFLGKTMGYTCGYYAGREMGMDEAQNEKMDIVCRKLRLSPGVRLLDIGCGWGNFAIFAARHYGADVTGITLSSEQREYALNWIEKENLSDKIKIRVMNYRDLSDEAFDAVSCIGMSEHVGRKNMSGFYAKVFENLKTGGLFLQHTITTNIRHKKGHKNLFLDRYMFPGGELMQEQALVDLADQNGFELLNAENFRPHYVQTLKDWISRMEQHKSSLLDIVSDHVFRIYYIFFIGSLIAFRNKEISLFQNLFYKTDFKNNSSDMFVSPFSPNEDRLAEY